VGSYGCRNSSSWGVEWRSISTSKLFPPSQTFLILGSLMADIHILESILNEYKQHVVILGSICGNRLHFLRIEHTLFRYNFVMSLEGGPGPCCGLFRSVKILYLHLIFFSIKNKKKKKKVPF